MCVCGGGGAGGGGVGVYTCAYLLAYVCHAFSKNTAKRFFLHKFKMSTRSPSFHMNLSDDSNMKTKVLSVSVFLYLGHQAIYSHRYGLLITVFSTLVYLLSVCGDAWPDY